MKALGLSIFLGVMPLTLGAATLTATYNSAADVPVTASSYVATGSTVNISLNYTPATGTSLTVINNTGLPFIQGQFSNLAQGQNISLSYGGIAYQFVANYFGGTGNDLVLQWAKVRPVAWGSNYYDQLGNYTGNVSVPNAVIASGVLAGKTITSVSVGGYHCMALCSDGTIAGWGDNRYGQLGNNTTVSTITPVTVTASGVLAGKTVIAISTGTYFSLALCSDGTVASWGDNNFDQLGNNGGAGSSVPVLVTTSGVLSGKKVVAISAGGVHALALCSDGTVVSWGYNGSGQLGNNSTASSPVPVAVTVSGALSGKTVTSISAGAEHSLALCSDGTALAWGENMFGEFGNNSTTGSNVPIIIPKSGALSGKTVTALSAGSEDSVALCSDGTVATFGYNNDGQLGNGSTTDSSVPVAVTNTGALSGKTVVAVTCASYFCLALCSDGTMVSWGSNNGGTLGNGGDTNSSVPVAVNTMTSLGGGERFVGIPGNDFALDSLGIVASPAVPSSDPPNTPVAWGWNANGQLGNSTTTSSAVPTAITNTGVLAGETVTAVSSGASHSVALCADGSMVSWGRNDEGELGNGSTTASSVPGLVTMTGALSGKTVSAISVGSDHSLALCSDGTVVAWGANNFGQLGNNSTNNSSVPVDVIISGALSGKRVTAIAAGDNHSVALCSDGTLVAWGDNFYGQLGNGGGADSSVPVTVTANDALSGETPVAIAAGANHSLTVCSDGSVFGWGWNAGGQLGNNTTLSSAEPVAVTTSGALFGKKVISVAAGYAHSLALCSDGTVAAWGGNESGELGNGSTSNSSGPVLVTTTGALAGKMVVTVSAGFSFSLALCSDGTAATWGYNGDGELGNNSQTNSSVPVTVNSSSLPAGESFLAVMSGPLAFHCLALLTTYPVITGTNTVAISAGTTFPGYSIVAAGSPTSYAASGLPPGLQVDTSTGVISGIATVPGTFVATLSATNSAGKTTYTVTFTVSAGSGLATDTPTMPSWALATLAVLLFLVASRTSLRPHLFLSQRGSGLSCGLNRRR